VDSLALRKCAAESFGSHVSQISGFLLAPLGLSLSAVSQALFRRSLKQCSQHTFHSSLVHLHRVIADRILLDSFLVLRLGQKFSTTRDACDITEEQIKTALKTQMWYDLAGDPVPNQVSALLKFTGKERLVFGSDVPWTPFEPTKALVARIERDLADCVGPDAVEMIWEGTAQGLLSRKEESDPASDLR